MKLLAASLVILMAAAGCTEKVHVTVNCVTTTKGAECTLVQTEGKMEVETCWDFAVTCGNGGVVTADRTCEKVAGGGTILHIIPNDHLHGSEQCAAKEGTPPKATITNITLNGQKSEL